MAKQLFEIFSVPEKGNLTASQLFAVMFRTKISLDRLRRFWDMIAKTKDELSFEQVILFLGLVSIYQKKHIIPKETKGGVFKIPQKTKGGAVELKDITSPEFTEECRKYSSPDLGLDLGDTLCEMKLKEKEETLDAINEFVNAHMVDSEIYRYYKKLTEEIKQAINEFYEKIIEEASKESVVSKLKADMEANTLDPAHGSPLPREELERKAAEIERTQLALDKAMTKAIGRYIETERNFPYNFYKIINEMESRILEKIKKEISDFRDILEYPAYFPYCLDRGKYERFGKPEAEVWVNRLLDTSTDYKGAWNWYALGKRQGPH